MKISRLNPAIVIACIFLSTTGFSDLFFKDDVFNQTEAFISQVRATAQPNAEITGLESKELKPYIPYKLTANDENPFSVKSFVEELGRARQVDDAESCQNSECGDGPPIAHAPFFLEGYSLDQLAMTGTLSNTVRGKVALILTPDSGIVHAAVGEYIGRNNGLILAIDRERIIIQEKYRTSQGWQNRNATLSLIRN